jgi:hypothetical protein
MRKNYARTLSFIIKEWPSGATYRLKTYTFNPIPCFLNKRIVTIITPT